MDKERTSKNRSFISDTFTETHVAAEERSFGSCCSKVRATWLPNWTGYARVCFSAGPPEEAEGIATKSDCDRESDLDYTMTVASATPN